MQSQADHPNRPSQYTHRAAATKNAAMEGEAEQPVKLTQGQYLAEMGVEALPHKVDPLLAALEARYEAECEKVRGLYVCI